MEIGFTIEKKPLSVDRIKIYRKDYDSTADIELSTAILAFGMGAWNYFHG